MSTVREAIKPLDPTALQRFLDGEHAEVRNSVRAQLAAPELAPVIGLEREEYRAKVLEWARIYTGNGEGVRSYPPEFGGEGDVGAATAAFETLAFGDLSLLVKIGVQLGLWGGAVMNLGTRKHHERYLRDTASLKLLGCFAMTETGHGSNVQGLETTATYDPATEEFIVNTPSESARKEFIGNAARDGHIAAVFCQLIVGGESHGIHAVVVPIREADGTVCAGVRIEDCGHKLGLNGVDNGILYFDAVRVPRDALLDRYATVTPEGRYESAIENPNKRFFTMLGTLVGGRVSVGGAALSATKVALTIAVRYAGRRRQFGPPDGEETVLLDYRTHQRRLLPALASTYALHFAQLELIAQLHEAFTGHEAPEDDQRRLEARAAGTKATSTWHATRTIQECREACGGAGYMAENRFATLKADTDVFTTFEGDNTVLMQLVAKSLLTDYKDQFGELDPLGMMGFVAGQVIDTVLERLFARKVAQVVVDAVPTREESADPLERAYQLTLFRWREEHIVASLARRLKAWIDRGEDPFEVFISCQDHVVAAGQAHIDRVVLEAFDRAVERCEDAELAAVLDRLCSLHALATIERDRGFFQEHGRISSHRSKAIMRAVGQLCYDLRGEAESLVYAFGVPDAVLGPIAQRG